ncbi:unnamed protein product [Blumeria hordei]|uniref:CCHC-type domain-containing protein n=1 Tax=Blumeria hordei TaxID=2867405 RepID=A0A383V1G8_BLUHO|nr:unnamed protein product [Blumeria hordei]
MLRHRCQISIEDRPSDLSKKDTLLRCSPKKSSITVQTIRTVAGDYSFELILNSKQDKPDEIALCAEGSPSINTRKEARKCYYCGKLGHM